MAPPVQVREARKSCAGLGRGLGSVLATAPGVKTINVRAIRDLAARMAGLETAARPGLRDEEQALAAGHGDPKLRWDRTTPRPGTSCSPVQRADESNSTDRRVRQAVSLAITDRSSFSRRPGYRQAVGQLESASNPRRSAAMDGAAGAALRSGKSEAAPGEGRLPNGLDFDWYVPVRTVLRHGRSESSPTCARRDAVQDADAGRAGLMAQTSKGRKGFRAIAPSSREIDPRPGGAKELIRLYAVCADSLLHLRAEDRGAVGSARGQHRRG